MKIGAHVSASGGVSKAIDRAQAIGAETIQVFVSSPQGWAFNPIPEKEVLGFRQKSQETGIGPAFLHGVYLVNVGSQSQENLEKGIASLKHYMHVSHQIGAAGVIFHSGSHKGVGFEGVLDQSVKALHEVLEDSSPDVSLIIENCAGMGNQIGASFGEIGRIMKALASPQVKVCLDTEHCFAAGYKITDKDAIEAAMDEFDREIGLSNLVAVHANDAKVPFGSGVDRHENIGEGYIGLEGFEVIMAHPAFREVPFLLEVPGSEGKGPDKENVDRLKAIREKLGLQS